MENNLDKQNIDKTWLWLYVKKIVGLRSFCRQKKRCSLFTFSSIEKFMSIEESISDGDKTMLYKNFDKT